jgi:Protein of unknown function (DUF2889)
MPLSAPAAREHIHTRHVECRGYRRADGLWDIEGHMTDVKSYAFTNDWRGEITPGVPLHEMWIRITVDEDLVIHEIEAVTDNSPYRMCPDIVGNFQRLKGMRMVGGFTNKMKAAVGGAEGCTHLAELMGPIATTAFQTIFPLKQKRERTPEEIAASAGEPPKRPPLLDTCHAFASDSPITKKSWPAFYTGPKDEA